MRVAFVDPDGQLVSLHNPVKAEAGLTEHPELADIYRDFYHLLPQFHRELPEDEVLFDPLGLPVALARLESGCYLLVGLEPVEPQFQAGQALESRAGAVQEQGRGWTHPVSDPEETRESLAFTAGLLNRLDRYLAHPDLPALLSFVDTLDQLIVSTFILERFDFKAILDLITSSLALITGSAGAFAFSYEAPGQMVTTWCGESGEIMQALASEWILLGEKVDPGEAFSGQVQNRVKREFKATARGICRTNKGLSLYLGLIGVGENLLWEVLEILGDKAAAALEVSSLSAMFQYSWKRVFNSIEQGIVVIDSRGAILIMNRAARDLLREQGVIPVVGHPMGRCGLGPQIEEAIRGASLNGYGFRQKHSTIGEGDSQVHLRWDVIPLSRGDGHSSGAVLIFNNITAPVQLEQEVRDWGKLANAGEIAASLAHEVRNPLATAKAAIQLLRMDGTPLKREELLDKLDRELDRMNSILTNFLNISRPDQGERLEPVNLGHALQDLLFFLNSEAKFHEIDLVTIIPDDNYPVVLGSPNSIKQICLNVARNAIEAMCGGGRLTITLFSKNGFAHITFQDTGPGIPAENITVLTRPFFTTKPNGTGLGLAISLAILKTMGGSLKIDSTPGEGTTVDLALPIYRG